MKLQSLVWILAGALLLVPFAAARADQPPALPANFDPCGGPQEILNKFGVTPCVVVGGEAMLSAGYLSAKVNGNIQVGSIATLPAAALVRSYPQALATVGLGPRTDVEFTLPSYTRVDTARFPLLLGGDTDFQVGFKQRVAFDPVHGTLASVAASVEFPTGSPALRAAGPSYNVQLLGLYALPRRFGLIYDMQLTNADAKATQERNTSLSLTVIPYYLCYRRAATCSPGPASCYSRAGRRLRRSSSSSSRTATSAWNCSTPGWEPASSAACRAICRPSQRSRSMAASTSSARTSSV